MSIIDPVKRLGLDMASLAVMDLPNDVRDLERMMKGILNEGIYGMSFSPYEAHQTPVHSKVTKEQIEKRMAIINPYTSVIRSFSCTEGNELIPVVAKEMGLGTMVGAWIGEDLEKNEEELDALIRLAKEGFVDMCAVGNEVLLRGELPAERIIDYMNRVREAVPGIPVGYVDAYYLFTDHPEVANACDVIFSNCYPYWEGCPLEYAVDYMRHMYKRVKDVAGDKPIVISETGWPNAGSEEKSAMPSYVNAMKYFISTYQWAEKEDIDVVYFSSFDEEWKVHHEGASGANWGLWNGKGQYKYDGSIL